MKKNLPQSLLLLTSLVLSTYAKAQVGTLDLSFGTNGIVQTVDPEGALDMIIQNDGKIVTVSTLNTGGGDIAIMRHEVNGDADNSFGVNGLVHVDFSGGSDAGNAIALQSDGKIIVVGSAQNSTNSNSDIALVRLNANGTLDNTFGTGGKVTLDLGNPNYESAYDVAVQSDGKIVVIGLSGTDMFCKEAILRFTTSGLLDLSFDGDGMISPFCFGSFSISRLNALTIQNDGKILVGGSKNNNFAVARLHTNGTLDSSYATNGMYTGITPVVTHCKLELQNDGKLVATYSSATQNEVRLLRLNTNGTEDSGFGVNGTVATLIPSGNYEYTKALTLQPDGKIIVAGSLFTSGFISDYLLMRYTAEGNLDTTFGAAGTGIVTTSVAANDEDRGLDVKLQPDGKIIVAGASCGGSCDFVLLRYINTVAPTGISENTASLMEFNLYPNPASEFIILDTLPDGATIQLTDITGKVVLRSTAVSKQLILPVSALARGTYMVQVFHQGSITVKKLLLTGN